LSPHRLCQLLWIGSLPAILLLPAGWRSLAWTSVTLAFLALVVWGVVSIRSPFFGRALVAGTNPGAVALTFDDGPDPRSTPTLLDLLERHGVTATFFVVGERVRSHPELARRCHNAGHELGNHSQRHSPWLNFRLRRGMRSEIAACQEALAVTIGRRAHYYRPPIGLRNPAVHPVCAELDLCVIGWQVRSLDKSRLTPAAVVERVLHQVRPGGIVLLHDGGQPSERLLAITEGILRGLEIRNLRAVSLRELLGPPVASSSGAGRSTAVT